MKMCLLQDVIELGSVLKSSQGLGVQELSLTCNSIKKHAPSAIGNATVSQFIVCC